MHARTRSARMCLPRQLVQRASSTRPQVRCVVTDHRNNKGLSKGMARPDLPRRVINSIAADLEGLPPVLVTSNDMRRLRAMLAEARQDADESVCWFLARELDR